MNDLSEQKKKRRDDVNFFRKFLSVAPDPGPVWAELLDGGEGGVIASGSYSQRAWNEVMAIYEFILPPDSAVKAMGISDEGKRFLIDNIDQCTLSGDGGFLIYDVRFVPNFDLEIGLIDSPVKIGNLRDVDELMRKARNRILSGDYDGAITMARTILEQYLLEFVHDVEPGFRHDGSMKTLFNKVKPKLKIQIEGLPDDGPFRKMAQSVINMIDGIAEYRNALGDSHCKKVQPERRHALFAVNISFSLLQYFVDIHEYQKNK